MQGHCSFFALCTIVASQSEINMKDIIGHYELSSVCHSFMDSWGEFNHDEEGKCKLADNKEYN